jgi:5-formyltetrahydrofolate cyclo-ligase
MAETKNLAKEQIRKAALAARDAMPPDARQAAAQAIAGRAFPVSVTPGAIISGFMH